MKSMTKEEAKAHENKLFLEHRYHEEEKKTIELDEELRAIIGDLNQYIVK